MIEVLFLLAPLAVVPLGLRVLPPAVRPLRAARLLWLPGAVLAAVSFLLPRGRGAALAALPWVAVTFLLGLSALLSLRRASRTWEHVFAAAGLAFIPVGGIWFLASRWTGTFMNFTEPIVLLTGVHFHYTGFAAPILASRLAGGSRPARAAGVGLLAGTPLLAAGFVVSPLLKFAAALLLVVSASTLGLAQLRALPSLRRPAARDLLALSSMAILAGMALAAAYALGEFRSTLWLGIPVMAWTHGLLNGVGFVGGGLMAWAFEIGHGGTEPRSRT